MTPCKNFPFGTSVNRIWAWGILLREFGFHTQHSWLSIIRHTTSLCCYCDNLPHFFHSTLVKSSFLVLLLVYRPLHSLSLIHVGPIRTFFVYGLCILSWNATLSTLKCWNCCVVKAEGIQRHSYTVDGTLKCQLFGEQFVNIYENYQYIFPLVFIISYLCI